MQIIKVLPQKTLSDHLSDMILGETVFFDMEKKNGVRAAIQRVFLRTGMKFTTKKTVVEGKKLIKVERVK